jgi:hypothetical protein
MQKLSLYETTKIQLSLTLNLTDILHVFIEKCKSKILMSAQDILSFTYSIAEPGTKRHTNKL